ncbi:hypothetical protein Agub_g12445 [Astrephomene gubernaculifera]|uniref:SAC3/GANP/THP3 conserved domain-containing protein n=1 Tax=Astrephomene gubernaculifera TaxID=47775 RepID=A0AAD3E092_9CHLO|nr:hypothetical protein Agub_g12445 [Astrephomene gubernaculifera]
MAYQGPAAYPAAGSAAWGASASAPADPSYYQQYYASYGYGTGYDYSAYYQHQSAYPQTVPEQGTQPQSAPNVPTPDSSGSAPAPPPPPPSLEGPSPAPPSSPAMKETSAAADQSMPPPPPQGDPPPPGAEGSDDAKQQKVVASSEASKQPSSAAAPAPAGYDAAAYAQWYAQTYGAYYSYPGYDQQSYAYWQQQQQPYAYTSQPYGQPQLPSIPPPAPPKGDPPGSTGRTKASQPSGSASPAHLHDAYNAQPPPSSLYGQQPAHKGQNGRQQSGSVTDAYNAQPPPVNLYGHQAHKGQHGRNQTGPTGPNTVPIGPRPPPGEPPAASTAQAASPAGVQQQSSRFRGPSAIRPQLPAASRPNAAASPAYIPVGSGSSTGGSSTSAVAAAVAAGAASAAAAASAAKSAAAQGSNQWPPSFTAWVTRCFNTARLRNIPDNRLSEKLMAYLEQVKAEGRLWTTDWDTQPVMLPDSPSELRGDAAASSQVLSPNAPQGRKRSRWGAVPEAHEPAYSLGGHPASRQHYERSQDVDTDEEDHGQCGSARKDKSSRGLDALQSLSNRKRKKLLQLEQQRRRNDAPSAEEMRRRARAGRFGDGRAAGAAAGGRSGGSQDEDSSGMDMSDDEELAANRFGGVVVGTCQALEKSYFRLTSQPDPASVRPEPVLERALQRLVGLIARGEATYFYSLDQFKGMRQDCTVQHLRNALAVKVYEAHARSSLEYGDTAEFNQCQARLGHLYAEGQPGCLAEFTAYRLLYETMHCASASGRSEGMAKSLLHTMRNVPRELAGSPEVRHALQVREAVMTQNYAAFFRLYASAPHLGRAIMDLVAESMRWGGLNAFVKACDLPVPVTAMSQLLGFSPRPEQAVEAAGKADAKPLPGCMRVRLEGEAAPAATEEEALVQCSAWLQEHGAVVVEKGAELLLDTKASRGKLFVPEVVAKVAHGDENLSVVDFLSRALAA